MLDAEIWGHGGMQDVRLWGPTHAQLAWLSEQLWVLTVQLGLLGLLVCVLSEVDSGAGAMLSLRVILEQLGTELRRHRWDSGLPSPSARPLLQFSSYPKQSQSFLTDMWRGHERSFSAREGSSLPKLPSLWTHPVATPQIRECITRLHSLKSRQNPPIGPITCGIKAIMVKNRVLKLCSSHQDGES